MALRLQTAASGLPVSLEDAKLHLRVDTDDENSLISSIIAAAALDAEHEMGRALMPQKWLLSLDHFAACISLKRPPVSAIDSVKYLSSAGGAAITVSPADYQLLNGSDYAADLIPAFGRSWPSTAAQPESVQILFTAGYADAASIPANIGAWIKLRIGALYEHREAWTAGLKIEQNPHVDHLLDRGRTWLT